MNDRRQSFMSLVISHLGYIIWINPILLSPHQYEKQLKDEQRVLYQQKHQTRYPSSRKPLFHFLKKTLTQSFLKQKHEYTVFELIIKVKNKTYNKEVTKGFELKLACEF